MRIVLVLKPYAVEVYSHEDDSYTLISVEQSTRIEGEALSDYEKRMVFVCKNLCTEMRASSFFKKISCTIKGIDVVLCAPWCTYDVVQVEKDLGKKTKITDAVLKSMFVKKDEKECHVVESYVSNILLNGYKVNSLAEQSAQTVQFQYVHVYARESFISLLTKTIETLLHTHKISIISMYGLVDAVSKKRPQEHTAEIQIIVEDESVDVSYISEGLRIVNVFIPQSYIHTEHDIALRLSAHPSVVGEILTSRSEYTQKNTSSVPTVTIDKNAKKLWPDLDTEVQKTINTCVEEGMLKVVQQIRNCIDTVGAEYLKNATSISVYCIDKKLRQSFGAELARTVAADPYLSMKIHPVLDEHSIKSIF